MNVYLNKSVGSFKFVDVTPYLDESQELLLMSERERVEFERTMPDFNLSLSNLFGDIESYFANISATQDVQVRITDSGRTLFFGFIESKTQVYERVKGMFSGHCYDRMKRLWDMMKGTYINQTFTKTEKGQVYVTLSYLLAKIFLRDPFTSMISGINIKKVGNIDIGATSIRFYSDTKDPKIGNKGKYADLMQTTTVADLMNAVLLYYNAEMFFDDESSMLIFQKRFDVVNDVKTNLDDLIADDSDIKIMPFGSKSYDFVYVPTKVPKLDPPSYWKSFAPSGAETVPVNLTMKYSVTIHVDYNGLSIESPPSDYLSINFTSVPTGFENFGVYIYLPSSTAVMQAAQLGLGNVTRRIYRMMFYKENKSKLTTQLYQIVEIKDNSATSFKDNWSAQVFGDEVPRPILNANSAPAVNAWYGFDQYKKVWVGPLMDIFGGVNQPPGQIFNAVPVLTFVNPAARMQTLAYEPTTVFDFFGKSRTTDEIREEWNFVLFPKCILSGKFKDRNFKVGDSVTTSKIALPPTVARNVMSIKKAAVGLISEKSELEVLIR